MAVQTQIFALTSNNTSQDGAYYYWKRNFQFTLRNEAFAFYVTSNNGTTWQLPPTSEYSVLLVPLNEANDEASRIELRISFSIPPGNDENFKIMICRIT